jgi:aerobic carbon-monoxide dehydrogenase medium subunit
MHPFEYHDPTTLADASGLLARFGAKASLLAGGTDLLVEIKEAIRRPDVVIDLKRIPAMAALSFDSTGGLRFGALVTAREIELSPEIGLYYPGLQQAVIELGSIQVRNRATVVGNICRASPSADTLPPLIADGASAHLYCAAGERVVPIEAFFTGPGKTVLRGDEIVTAISAPAPASGTGRAYIKHGRRKAMELATVGVAVSVTMDGDTCRDIRIALGAVAPTPIRALAAETALRGQLINEASLALAAEAAMQAATPISNVRATAAYRREMVGVLTKRAIRLALSRIKGSKL